MNLFGTKDRLSRLLDNLEQGKEFGYVKIIFVTILDLMGYMLLFGLFLIIIPMLLPVIILVLLQKPLLFVLTVLESLIHSRFGMEVETNLKKYIRKGTRTR
jgi:hypothetical protein